MQFDATETLGALAKLPPEPPKPVEAGTTAGGLWRAVRNAVPAAAAESLAMVAKGASIAFDDSPDNRGPVRQFGEEVERSLRNVAESYGPDPMTASKAEQVVYGLTRGVGKAVGYGLTTGPAAPFLFGADEGLTEREKLLRQGVDEATATKVGALAGAVNVAGFAIPAAGATVAKTIGLATLSGPASFVAQQAGSREILRNADYESIASSYDPTDALGLGLSAIPFGFGAWAMRGRLSSKAGVQSSKPDALSSKPAPDAIPVEPVRAADELGVSPDITPATPDVAARSPDVVARADHIVDANKMVEPVLTQEHVDAAMVKNLVDFDDGVKANPPEKFEAELSRAEVTGSDDFKGWFGGSRVIDASNQPVVMYHGTTAEFDVFDTTRGSTPGAWFTEDAGAAAEFGQPKAVFLNIKNPASMAELAAARRVAAKTFDAMEQQQEFNQAVIAELERAGFDGIHDANFQGAGGDGSRVWAALRPDQIRPATRAVTKPTPEVAPTTKETPADVPPPEKLGTEAREAPAPEGKAEVGKAAEGAADAATVAVYKSEAERILETNPDMVVDVDAQGNKVTAREALEKIRREAAEGTATELGADDAKLVKVAAECALSFGE